LEHTNTFSIILIFLNSYSLVIGTSCVSAHCATVCWYARLADNK